MLEQGSDGCENIVGRIREVLYLEDWARIGCGGRGLGDIVSLMSVWWWRVSGGCTVDIEE